MFEGLKTMKDIVQGSIDAVKATGKLDKMVEESRKDYKEELTDEDRKLFKKYKKLKEKYEAEQDMEKANGMMEEVEAAEVAYLLSLTKNKDLPKAFRRQVQEAVDAYAESNEAVYGIVEKAMLRYAKDDDEKEMVKMMMEGARATEKLDEAVEESRKKYKDSMSAMNDKLYQSYKKRKDKHAAEKDLKKANAMIEKIEAAEVAYLLSLTENPELPEEFRTRIQEAVDAYTATNAEISERVEELAMKHAEDEEEKGLVQKIAKKVKKQ